ncbi:MAG TPA: ParB N-terminal domain-containing protein [Patescibacteria group bacterium]|nr:ParB N-terminal domain-containing protein [Patescibacteria group bacterium]
MSETGEVPIKVVEATPKPFVADPNKKIETGGVTQIDARDYFAIGKFQKKAESIDSDNSHPWSTVQYVGFLAENDYGAIAAGETYDTNLAQTSTETPFGLLIAEKTSGGQGNSVFVRDLDRKQRGYVMDAINTFAPSLPDATRHQLVRRIIQEAPNLKDEKVIVEKLTRMGLELLPDHANRATEALPQWIEVGGQTPSVEQQKELAEFTRLVASKVPKEEFDNRMKKLQDDLRFTDDPYGRNYQTIFAQMSQWVLDGREDASRNYGILQREKPTEYTIKDKVTHPIATEDELKERLSSLPVEPMPDTIGRSITDETTEIVKLDQVVGGTGIETWSVSTSEGRGLSKILELTRELQSGNASVAGRNEPIRLIEVDGKYYVESDGRHRTAALKALGVAEVPVMVTHFK